MTNNDANNFGDPDTGSGDDDFTSHTLSDDGLPESLFEPDAQTLREATKKRRTSKNTDDSLSFSPAEAAGHIDAAVTRSSQRIARYRDSQDHDEDLVTLDALIQRSVSNTLNIHREWIMTQTPERLRTMVIGMVNDCIVELNQTYDADPNYLRLSMVHRLPNEQIAQLMILRHHVTRIKPAGTTADPSYDILAIYDQDPSSPTFGTHQADETVFNRLARLYNPSISINALKEVMAILKDSAPRRERVSDPDLIAVGNGVFNYKTKQLTDFTPELVFMSKAGVDYHEHVFLNDGDPVPEGKKRANPILTRAYDAEGQPIHDPWNVEDWMLSLTPEDPELALTLWQILGATLRPNVPWGKSAWLYSQWGNNGKGTLTHFARGLCGDQSHTSISVKQFSKEFMLTSLVNATAIITDENDVGTYIDGSADMKAVITGDVIMVNRKHRDPVAVQFRGFMIQCLNDLPMMRDRSESMYRRQIFIPMKARFTGREKPYIKQQFLVDKDVQEYALWKLLAGEAAGGLPDYYRISEPACTQELLEQYKIANNPVHEFWTELREQFSWKLLPWAFLYDLYLAWMRKTNPEGKPVKRRVFTQDLTTVLDKDPMWTIADGQIATSGRMDYDEPLAHQYKLDSPWRDPHNATGENDKVQLAPQRVHRGLLRTSFDPMAQIMQTINDDDTTPVEPKES